MKGQRSHSTPHYEGPETPDVSHVRNLQVQHEESDINVRGIVRFAVGLVVSAIVTFAFLFWLYNFYEGRTRAKEVIGAHVTKSMIDRLPPEPRLQLAPGHQIHPMEELRRLQDSNAAVLQTYGWVDQKAGVVRLPIERAEELLIARGLPSRAETPEQKAIQNTPGVIVPEFSSAGRMLISRDQRLPHDSANYIKEDKE